jgi:hypothetical protein
LDSKLIFRWLSLTINHAYWTSYKHKSCKPANWKKLVALCCQTLCCRLLQEKNCKKSVAVGEQGILLLPLLFAWPATCTCGPPSCKRQYYRLGLRKNTHHETLRTDVKMKFQRRFMVPVSRRQQVPDWEHTWRHKSVWVATTAGWAVTIGDTKSCLIYIFCRGNSVKFTISMHMCKNQVKIMCTYVGGVLSIFLFWRHSL